MRTIPTDAAVGQDPTTAAVARSDRHAFPKADDCRLAAQLLYAGHDDDPTAPARTADAFLDAQAAIGVTPGGITLYKRLRPIGREIADPADPLGQQQFPHVDEAQAADDELGPWHGPMEREPIRLTRWWSARSRSRMIRALASVDWEPIFFVPGTRPAMVTLTYPGDWLTVAPDAPTCKAHLAKWHKRLNRMLATHRRQCGRTDCGLMTKVVSRRKIVLAANGDHFHPTPLPAAAGVWKLEFQRRGAPHFHIYMPVPVAKVWNGDRMVRFVDWLSESWADVVDHPDDEQRARHVAAGTGLDFAEGARCSDPKRLAVYFTRHNAKGGRSKAYQHRVPDAWTDAGRWWGTWGVGRINYEAPVTEQELVEVKRLLRRWVRSSGRVTPRRVRRGVSPSGVVRHRWVTRRYEIRSLSQSLGGFVIANDGPALAAMLSRYLEAFRLEAEPA